MLALLPVAACSASGAGGEPDVANGAGGAGAAEARGGEQVSLPAALAAPEPETAPPEPQDPGGEPVGSPVAGNIDPPQAPPAAAEPASPEPPEACHPAYHPCLADLPGDALDCADLADDLKPVVVRDPAVDPYRLATGAGRRACLPAGVAVAGGADTAAGASGSAAGAAAGAATGDGARPRGTSPAPPAAEIEPPDVENVAAVCGPGTEPSGNSRTADPATPPGTEPAPTTALPPDIDTPPDAGTPPPEPTEPGTGPAPTTAPPPEPTEPGTGPAPTTAPPPEPTGPGSPDDSRAVAGDEWCLPETTGGAVRLFWCEDDLAASPDLEVHGGDATEPAYRTGPLALEAGTRIERYSTCTGLNAVEEVVGFDELPAAADGEPALGVQLCGRFFLGEELYSWGLSLYRAWQDPDGRYRIEMPEPVEYLGTC